MACMPAAIWLVWPGCVSCRKAQGWARALWCPSGVCSSWLCGRVVTGARGHWEPEVHHVAPPQCGNSSDQKGGAWSAEATWVR